MILGIGIDIVDIGRISSIHSRYGHQFARHILHEAELSELPPNPRRNLASRFAAKEALVKALGTGFSRGVVPAQIRICHDSFGRPHVILHGQAKALADQMGATSIHLSISHEREYAMALVILEG